MAIVEHPDRGAPLSGTGDGPAADALEQYAVRLTVRGRSARMASAVFAGKLLLRQLKEPTTVEQSYESASVALRVGMRFIATERAQARAVTAWQFNTGK